jgi:hypothetical protein
MARGLWRGLPNENRRSAASASAAIDDRNREPENHYQKQDVGAVELHVVFL